MLSRLSRILCAVEITLRFSSIRLLTPLHRPALIHQAIIPALGSFQTSTGIGNYPLIDTMLHFATIAP